MKIFIFVILVVGLLTGCVGSEIVEEEQGTDTTTILSNHSKTITRGNSFGMVQKYTVFHDDVYNVTCFELSSVSVTNTILAGDSVSPGVGLSCIPDWQLQDQINDIQR